MLLPTRSPSFQYRRITTQKSSFHAQKKLGLIINARECARMSRIATIAIAIFAILSPILAGWLGFSYPLQAGEPTAQDPTLQDQFQKAAGKTLRMMPGAFPQLPQGALKRLETRGCTIPQSYSDVKSHNVIQGEFAKQGQADWAALCSRNGTSEIWVFWGGPARCTNELGTSADVAWLQRTARGKIVYSRKISPITRSAMLHYPERPPMFMNHDGIEDTLVGKSSTIFYCRSGKWIRLAGANAQRPK